MHALIREGRENPRSTAAPSGRLELSSITPLPALLVCVVVSSILHHIKYSSTIVLSACLILLHLFFETLYFALQLADVRRRRHDVGEPSRPEAQPSQGRPSSTAESSKSPRPDATYSRSSDRRPDPTGSRPGSVINGTSHRPYSGKATTSSSAVTAYGNDELASNRSPSRTASHVSDIDVPGNYRRQLTADSVTDYRDYASLDMSKRTYRTHISA